MSTTPREIGTLIVVVLKANHLPNKRHIGKQDPYCLVTHNGEKRRTKAIKRGGQHPEWDEEIRFTLYEDQSNAATTVNGTPTPPPKEGKGPKKVKGGWTMKIACFADDPREPDLIGEADVDLTEVLTKGETDEWFTLMNKDKFSGKVYLELTFWSNEPAPEKKATPKPGKSKQYGGPGSFVPSGESPSGLPSAGSHSSRILSTGAVYDHSRQNSDSIPSSLRASSSLAKLDLYVPPYERSVDTISNEFGDLGISNRRRESAPPRTGQTPRPASPNGYSTISSRQSHGFDRNISELSSFGYDNLSDHSLHARASTAHYQTPYQPQYESQPSYHPPARGPRHSIPASSSGFVPLPGPSGYAPLSSHSSEPSLFAGPPTVYNTTQFNSQPVYTSQTTSSEAYLMASTSGTFVPQQSFPQSQSFQYVQYPPSTIPVQGQLPLVQSFTPAPTPTHDAPLSTLPHNNSVTSSFGASSRPLPLQPQVVYAQPQTPVVYSTSPAGLPQPPINSFTPSQAGSVIHTTSVYQHPPPPAPPTVQYTVGQSQSNTQTLVPPPPPPPLPPLANSSSPNRRQSSLPQPPVIYQQLPPSVYQPLPPPPPPPSDLYNHPHPPPPPPPVSAQNPPYHSNPLPTPPATVDGQGQWIAPESYAQHGY